MACFTKQNNQLDLSLTVHKASRGCVQKNVYLQHQQFKTIRFSWFLQFQRAINGRIPIPACEMISRDFQLGKCGERILRLKFKLKFILRCLYYIVVVCLR